MAPDGCGTSVAAYALKMPFTGIWRTFVGIKPNSLHTAVSECPPVILIDDGALSPREDEQCAGMHTMSGRVSLGNSGRKLRKSLEESIAHSVCGVFCVADL
jgi:hypothetical protein